MEIIYIFFLLIFWALVLSINKNKSQKITRAICIITIFATVYK